MRRRRPDEEEARGVWLDAAALKRRKVQTQLIKPGTKMLTLLPRERKPSVCFTQRSSTRQTSMASFITLKSGMTNGGNQKRISSQVESQINKESKKDATQLDHWVQRLGDDCLVPPLATSTPADVQESRFSPQSLQTSSHHSLETPVLTVPSLPQSDILECAQENKASLAFSFTQDLESSCLLDQRMGKSRREWIHGLKTTYPDTESHVRPPGGNAVSSVTRLNWERVCQRKQAGTCTPSTLQRTLQQDETTTRDKKLLSSFSVFLGQ